MSGNEKAWGGRFREGAAAEAEHFTASLPVDQRLWREDLQGSRAHARMLGQSGILAPVEAEAILQGLREIEAEIEEGSFPFRMAYEDIHLNIERRLIEKIGSVGGKLHTARSRNDQVALDEHLFVKRACAEQAEALLRLQRVLLQRSEGEMGVPMPGYTHLQRAQPVLLSHHLLAYVAMLERDRGRFVDVAKRADLSPLGAAALAGTPFPINRRMVAEELGLAGVYENSLDAVSDRDSLLEFCSAAAIAQMHLSRLAEELILWSSHEFGFVEFADAYATGSSIMPQKKNPDTAELIRGKAGRVYGNLMALLTIMKGVPLAYHTDLQEDKARLFDSHDTLLASLQVAAGILETVRFRRERLSRSVREDLSTATDLADYLAWKGMPFREAHGVVGRLVLTCLEQDRLLSDLSLEELQGFSSLFGADALEVVLPERSLAARTSEGGTAPEQVERQLRLWQERLGPNPPAGDS